MEHPPPPWLLHPNPPAASVPRSDPNRDRLWTLGGTSQVRVSMPEVGEMLSRRARHYLTIAEPRPEDVVASDHPEAVAVEYGQEREQHRGPDKEGVSHPS